MVRLAGFSWLLAILAALRPATAQLPPNTHEFDLVFPRAGGVYATQFENNTASLPVVLAVQNPDSAYRYGFSFWWDVYQQPHRDDFDNHFPRFRIGASLGNDTTFPGNTPYLATATTEMMDAGNYTFHWRLRTGAWCEYLPDSTAFNSAEYAASHDLANGSFSFAVEKGAPAATFTATCPTPLAVAGYLSTTVYRGLDYSDYGRREDTATETLTCGIMANATVAPQACSATVDAAQEASISSAMQWGTSATGSARETGAPSSGHVNSVGAWPVVVLSTAVVWGMV
ncbi:hypothetical protein CMUS01_03308 [Colletotrichum musicola]|uniref:DUF7136 domain-containing protein n=1 Tax=Colletotrichum musicola TaxID=2175873 RepID=A0A8H6NTF8_9PEZI|nr:hypothetical protein CMUS01_03308 [Colletotrichum musicola]